MSGYVCVTTKPFSGLTLIDAYVIENSLKIKAAASIRQSKPHHKHAQTDVQTGQLIETGAEVLPRS